MLVLSIFLAFAREGTPQDIIDKLIKPPFKHLYETGQIKVVPEWVLNLSLLTINTFAQEVLDTYFKGDEELFTVESKELREKLTLLSNQISQRQLLQYLRDHSDVTTIYGLIGSIHLVMLDSVGKIISKDDGYYHIQVNIDDRIVDVHLFGGTHGETAHYKKMADFVGEIGLVVPEPSSLPKPTIDINLLLSVLATESNSRYSSSGRLSSRGYRNRDCHRGLDMGKAS